MSRFMSKSRFSTSRRTQMTSPERWMENLEPRQMLAADLGVVFDDFSNAPPTLIPGDRVTLPIVVRNVGNSAAVGTVSIDYFLSTNATFDNSDTLLRTFASQPVSLSADGFENSEGTFEGTVTIPTIAPGNYFFLVRLRPNSNVGDFNQSNNIAASETTQAFAWKFGTFDNRTNATLTLTDPSGTEVSFSLSGGGSGTVTRDATNTERFDVVLTGTGGNSSLVIQSSGGSGSTAGIGLIDDISGGSLASIDARSCRLYGDVSLTGSLGSLRFGDVFGPSTITVQTGTVNTTYTFGNVTDLTINSAAPITSLTVSSWTDSSTNPGGDVVSAPWIGTLTSTGVFQASLDLSGRTGGRTLVSANIGGKISKGSWRINGTAGTLSAQSTAGDWSASIVKALKSFTTTQDFRGVLAAKSIGTLTVGRDIRAAKVLAGADLGADARLGGTDGNADTFANGTVTAVNVARKAINVIIGAGLDPVDGTFKNGNDVYRGGKITRITIAGAVGNGNRFLAPRYVGEMKLHGVTVNPAADIRFQI